MLEKIPISKRKKVQEVTLDLAPNMSLIVKRAFTNAVQVIDRFHVQQLATEALQEIRIKYRWQAMDAENEAIEKAKQGSSIKVVGEFKKNANFVEKKTNICTNL